MQPFFTTKNHSTFGGQFAPKMGGQFHRNFQNALKATLKENSA